MSAQITKENDSIMKIKKPLRFFSILLLLALLTALGVQFINQEIVLKQQNAQIAKMTQDKQRLNDDYAALLEQAKDKGSLQYIERYMRDRFGMVKDNEWIINVEGNSN